MRVYVASSWRNARQPEVVERLRAAGHEVYDFRHPAPGNDGFAWSAIDPAWKGWNSDQFRNALHHPVAVEGFRLDFDAMKWANAFVLVHPCGRSAHLEAGWATGRGVPVFVLLEEGGEPELMLKLVEPAGGGLFRTLDGLIDAMRPRGPTLEDDRKLVDRLCAIEEGLTEWEERFVESIAARVHGHDHREAQMLTPAQRERALQIDERT